MARQNSAPWVPSDKQHAVLEAAREVGLQRNISVIAMESGVSRAAIYVWFREDPDFKAAWDNIPREMLGNHMPGIYSALVKKAQSGDVAAIKLAMELTGDYVAGVQRLEVKHEGQIDLSCLTEDDLNGLEAIAAKLRERGRNAVGADRSGEAPKADSN